MFKTLSLCKIFLCPLAIFKLMSLIQYSTLHYSVCPGLFHLDLSIKFDRIQGRLVSQVLSSEEKNAVMR